MTVSECMYKNCSFSPTWKCTSVPPRHTHAPAHTHIPATRLVVRNVLFNIDAATRSRVFLLHICVFRQASGERYWKCCARHDTGNSVSSWTTCAWCVLTFDMYDYHLENQKSKPKVLTISSWTQRSAELCGIGGTSNHFLVDFQNPLEMTNNRNPNKHVVVVLHKVWLFADTNFLPFARFLVSMRAYSEIQYLVAYDVVRCLMIDTIM